MSPTLDLGHLNDLNDDVVIEVYVKEALKSSIFIVQKAAAPKSGVEFRQGSIKIDRKVLLGISVNEGLLCYYKRLLKL